MTTTFYTFEHADHVAFSHIEYLFPEMHAANIAKGNAITAYNDILDLNQKKVKHACANYYDYQPYYERGRAYYDEAMRAAITEAWNNMETVSMERLHTRHRIMATVYTPTRISTYED